MHNIGQRIATDNEVLSYREDRDKCQEGEREIYEEQMVIHLLDIDLRPTQRSYVEAFFETSFKVFQKINVPTCHFSIMISPSHVSSRLIMRPKIL